VELVVAVDGTEWTRVRATALGARAWLLGVVAVQLAVEEGAVRAQVRASVTGAAAEVRPLGVSAVVQVALVEEGGRPEWPAVASVALDGDEAAIACVVEGETPGRVGMSREQLDDRPARRAFAHVYCRWVRDGGIEPGFDLTEFLSKAPGEMYERALHRTLAPGQVISYAVAVRAPK